MLFRDPGKIISIFFGSIQDELPCCRTDSGFVMSAMETAAAERFNFLASSFAVIPIYDPFEKPV